MEALEAIYGSDAIVIEDRRLQIRLDDGRTVLDLRLSSPGEYPAKPPCIALRQVSKLVQMLTLTRHPTVLIMNSSCSIAALQIS